MPSFLVELKKRRVYRVAIGYAVAAWLIVQIAATVLPAYRAPDWILPILITLIALGFPVALVLAWAFDLTPLGIRSDPGTGAGSKASNRGAWLVASFGLAVGGLALGGYWLWHSRPAQPPGKAVASSTNATAAIPAKSIAVLPFQNMSDDKQNAYFADGVQEEILTTLAKVADLRVISRTSVMQFRDAEKRDLRGIAQQLGVAHVLEGSVQRAANRVRVTAQLIDARTDAHVWGDRYDRELADVFGIQTEIAQKIAGQLKAALSPNERAAIQSQPTLDTAAYDLYLRARELVRGGKDDLQEQVRLLDEAVTRDPAFLQALCLLAQVHLLAYWGDHDPTPARLERARKALEAAARLRPDAGEVHLARALFHYWGNRDYAPALAELALAGRTLPNDADVLHYTGLIERRQGRWEESTGTLERALVLDPGNSNMASDLVTNYRALRRYDVAKRFLDNLLAWKPGDAWFQLFRAQIDWDESADLRRLQELFSGDVPATPDQNMLATNRYWVALLQRDYRAAEKAFSEYRPPDLLGSASVIEREYQEGIIARGLGDAPRAEAAFLRARERAAASVAARPSDAKALMQLASIDAKLGRKGEAVREAERAVALLPVANDAVLGPILLSDLATVYAEVGKTDRSLDVLEQAVALPCGPSYATSNSMRPSIPCAKTRGSRRSSRQSPLNPARPDTEIAAPQFPHRASAKDDLQPGAANFLRPTFSAPALELATAACIHSITNRRPAVTGSAAPNAMDLKKFFTELKRRNVYRVAVAYAVVGWLVIQVATATFPVLQIPAWAMRLVVVLVLLGFPLALVLAWAFELTPDGIKRSANSDPPAPRPRRGASIIMLIIAAAVALWLLAGRPFPFKAKDLTGTTNDQNIGGAAKSIAVLPFASLSEDQANAYFAEGIQDEILTRLAKISDLKVISRTSTLRYKSAPENLLEIAKQLGVAHILEGSVQKSGDRVRINVQLINAQTDSHLWAESYDRTLTDVFAVESEVAQRVADSLRATLTGVEKATLANKPTENPAAYDAYLRGLAVVASNRETALAFTSAADFFDEAVRLDPKFALAWARASIAHSRAHWGGYDRTATRAERAKNAAERAKELEPELGETFLARGYYEYIITRDYDAAWAAFKAAFARLPNNSDALVALSFIERRKGKWPEALAHQEQAAQRDPQNLPVLSQLGVTYFALKRFADSHAIVDRLLALAPENPQVLAGLARLCLAEGNLEGAETAMRSVPPVPTNDYIFDIQVRLALISRRYDDAIRLLEAALNQPPATLGVYAGKYRYLLAFGKELAGDRAGARANYEEARQELETLLQEQADSPEAAMYLGFVQAALGNKESALHAAQQAIDLRPASVDAVAGSGFEEARARIKARFGETDAVLLELRRLLKVSYVGPEQMPLTPALLRLDPLWDPLRTEPRFRELCEGKQP